MKYSKKKNEHTHRTLKSVIDPLKTIAVKTKDGKKSASKFFTIHKGYIRVGVSKNKDGEMIGFTAVKKKQIRSMGSICLFIAGGKDIDIKVEKANAELRDNL